MELSEPHPRPGKQNQSLLKWGQKSSYLISSSSDSTLHSILRIPRNPLPPPINIFWGSYVFFLVSIEWVFTITCFIRDRSKFEESIDVGSRGQNKLEARTSFCYSGKLVLLGYSVAMWATLKGTASRDGKEQQAEMETQDPSPLTLLPNFPLVYPTARI